ncbi:Hypp5940 [Branchiostoma lanceolatum]|uniref:Hypp5940 protein n=1 Tax=Branchiostoma lanceolatum TaxID=7740 RepID=A0A8J9YS45_BRALA|nr:Hypp5940 [Branchiostoma lanceolatum]
MERQSGRLILKDNEEQLDDGSGLTAPAIDKSTGADDTDFEYPAARDKIDDSRKETKMKPADSFLKWPQDDNDFLDDAESTFLTQSITKRSNSSSGSTFVSEKQRESTSEGSLSSSKHDWAFTPTSSNGTRNDSILDGQQLDIEKTDGLATDVPSMQNGKLSTKLEDLGSNKSLTMRHQNITSGMMKKKKTPPLLGIEPTDDSPKTMFNSTAINKSVNAKETVNHLQPTARKMPVNVSSLFANAAAGRDDGVQKAVEYESSMLHGRERDMMKTKDSITSGDGLPLMSSTSRGSSLSIQKPRERYSASTLNGTVNKPIRSRHARLTSLTRKTYKRRKLPLKLKKYESTGRGSKYKRPNSETFGVNGRQFNNLVAGAKDKSGSSDLTSEDVRSLRETRPQQTLPVAQPTKIYGKGRFLVQRRPNTTVKLSYIELMPRSHGSYDVEGATSGGPGPVPEEVPVTHGRRRWLICLLVFLLVLCVILIVALGIYFGLYWNRDAQIAGTPTPCSIEGCTTASPGAATNMTSDTTISPPSSNATETAPRPTTNPPTTTPIPTTTHPATTTTVTTALPSTTTANVALLVTTDAQQTTTQDTTEAATTEEATTIQPNTTATDQLTTLPTLTTTELVASTAGETTVGAASSPVLTPTSDTQTTATTDVPQTTQNTSEGPTDVATTTATPAPTVAQTTRSTVPVAPTTLPATT